MKDGSPAYRLLPILLVLAAAVGIAAALGPADAGGVSALSLFQSPAGTPSSPFDSPLPTPRSPEPEFSEAARLALAYIAERDHIPVEDLRIVRDQLIEFPGLGRNFQLVTLSCRLSDCGAYKMLVDLSTGQIEEDLEVMWEKEKQARQTRFGKLQPALYKRLQTLGDEDTLPVAIWIKAQPGETMSEQEKAAFAALAARYPEAKEALERSGRPWIVSDPEFARRIEVEYEALITARGKALVQPLLTELESQGISVHTFDGMPSLTATLSRRMILSLKQRADVDYIYLLEGHREIELDSAASTILAPAVWDQGYDGSGVDIAILDWANVHPDNAYLNLTMTPRPGEPTPGEPEHATQVALVAASTHGTYKGIAYGAEILSVGIPGSDQDMVDALVWAHNQGFYGVHLANVSVGLIYDSYEVEWVDRAFDFWTYYYNMLVIKSAGNNSERITSPGRAWNVLTVGAFGDRDDNEWLNDYVPSFSNWRDPYSPHFDREKPEVVAVGVGITLPDYDPRDGTSFAAPQVAGLAALLADATDQMPDDRLIARPETMRAIIMASATHNIEGDSVIRDVDGDQRDGAGGIRADLAVRIAQNANPTGCSSGCFACWWDESTGSLPVQGYLEQVFYAQEGDLVRIAIAWWAKADAWYETDVLKTNLDLRVRLVNHSWDDKIAESISQDNNYELVEFFAPQDGYYILGVEKESVASGGDNNYVGIAFLRIPLPYEVDVPASLYDYYP